MFQLFWTQLFFQISLEATIFGPPLFLFQASHKIDPCPRRLSAPNHRSPRQIYGFANVIHWLNANIQVSMFQTCIIHPLFPHGDCRLLLIIFVVVRWNGCAWARKSKHIPYVFYHQCKLLLSPSPQVSLHLPHICPSFCSMRWTATPNSCDNARCCSLTGSTRRGCEGCDGWEGWEGCDGCAEGAAARRSCCFTARGGYLAEWAWSKCFHQQSWSQKLSLGCFQKYGKTPKWSKWMVKMRENPIKIRMIWGYHYFWKHPLEHPNQKMQVWFLITSWPFKSHGLSSSIWLALLWLSSWPWKTKSWSSKKPIRNLHVEVAVVMKFTQTYWNKHKKKGEHPSSNREKHLLNYTLSGSFS